jgi:polyhydroxyalkanoate synthase
MEHWVDEVLPEAIRAVSAHAGGRPVHLVGWSLGGIFTMLAAADQPSLPIASLAVLGSPVDVREVPLVAPMRPLLNLTEGRGGITRAYRALGGIPTPLVEWAFQLASVQKMVTKPLAVATHLDDADYLAQIEAVDRFMANMTAYPGRSFGQVYHRMIKGNALVAGSMPFGDRTIELSQIKAPVLVFGGATDGIAPIKAVRAVVPLLTGSPEVRFEIVPGGHLGMLTGRAARNTTWMVMDEWIEKWSQARPEPSAKKVPTKKTAAKKGAAKKTAAKSAAEKGATKKTAKKTAKKTGGAKKTAKRTAGPEAIGVNPVRRHGSDSSRSLRS